jgi:CelD/BcsL family acetyltransferase involved in cellulose biosynthesis
VAGEITYRFKDRLFFAQAAYNPKFAELSPGIVFAGLVLKDFSGKNYTIGDNLCGYADYLNPWATGIKETTRVNIFRKSIVVAVLIAAWRIKRWITRKSKSDLPWGQSPRDRHDSSENINTDA